MSKPKDEPPTPPTDEPPTDEPPTPPTPPTPDPPTDDMPEWGKTLMGKVNGLEAAVTDLATNPPKPDESPQRRPWHKRGVK